jgi:trehalose 6-phosphate phosphatase
VKDILAAAQRRVLRAFMSSDVVVAFDFDGTLAPIVRDPDAARMRVRTRTRLARLAELCPVAVISGRSRADVLARLDGIALRAVLGNHGVDPGRPVDPALAAVTRRWRTVLEGSLARFSGATLEDKGSSVAIHYRRCRDRVGASAALLEAASRLGAARIIRGKQVLDILPRGAPHKGMALERVRDRLGCDAAIYVGDDETDEDVFRLDQPGRLLSVRVGRKARSSAAYYVATQQATDDLLALLITLAGSPR